MICEAVYDGTLEGLFALLDRLWAGALPEERWPRRVRRQVYPGGPAPGTPQTGLFDAAPAGGGCAVPAPGGFLPSLSPPGLLPDPAALDGAAGVLFQVSADAYDSLVYAWMSGFPIEGEALRYALRVLAAAKEAVLAIKPGGPAAPACGSCYSASASGGLRVCPFPGDTVSWYSRGEAREGATRAARNRGHNDCRAVLTAAGKVAHEISRFMGFLRFKPDSRGRYAARCFPDHFILPALEPHFSRRFGDTPWAVIDEKRGLALVAEGEPRIIFAGKSPPLWKDAGRGPLPPGVPCYDAPCRGGYDAWEKLWRSYHRIITIENRRNPSLQRQFVPLRYREYLTEFGHD
jgi:probable DNA metabolism protein